MRLVAPVLAALALAACGQPLRTSQRIEVGGAWCRPTPNGVDVGACYLRITSSAADRLVSASSPRAGGVMIHRTTGGDGMMRMEEAEGGVALTADEAVIFAPGGDHLMLTALAEPLVEGQRVPLTLTFERGGELEIAAVVTNTPPAG